MSEAILAGLAALLLINGASAALFALDKRQARLRGSRVPERTLLLAALLGGSPGAYWARGRFRHKTRKQPFSAWLHAIALAQLALLGALAWWWPR